MNKASHLIWTAVFLTVFLFYACSKVETVENRENGVLLEKYTRLKSNLARHGLYTAYFPNGKPKEESWYENDTLHGQRKLFYENGQLKITENYEHGAFVGKFLSYYENGKTDQEGQYVNNEMAGLWKRYYDTGELMEEVRFEHNEENGLFKEYHKNGKLKTEGTYRAGDFEQGELKKYDITGELIEKMFCQKGVCMTVWSKEKGDVPLDTARMRELVNKLEAIE
jgi:antitoxin component YwqK of YwqJK toxin-antitoxin module